MKDSEFAQQLVGELPSLVAQNVIDANTAGALQRHYEPRIKPSRATSAGLTIIAVLGGLLVGAGIILLIAHNWEELSRPMRAVFAMLPLIVSIGLSGCTILRRMDSSAWREGCGVFYFLSIGASIALVSQTYHLYNDLESFLFYWAVLSLPVIYLLCSVTAFAGSLACVTAYAFQINEYWRAAHFSLQPFALLALTVPFYVWLLWKRRDSLSLIWASWVLAIALALVLSTPLWKTDAVFWWVYCGLLGTIYYLAGCHWFGGRRWFGNPFRMLGCLSIAITPVILTYEWVYRHWLWGERATGNSAIIISIVLLLAWLGLLVDLVRRKIAFNEAAAFLPLMLAVVVFYPAGDVMPLFMNLYALALGVFTLIRGIRRDSLLSMNEGLVLIVALIACRFFEDRYGLIERGVAFILAGCGFFALNLFVLRSRKDKKGRTT